MPKRRITTAKQKAASRRNGKQHKGIGVGPSKYYTMDDLNKRKGLPEAVRREIYKTGFMPHPTGKTTLLYHIPRDAVAADSIMKSRKWISGTKLMGGIRGHSQFTTARPLKRFPVSSVVLTVKVPRKKVVKIRHEEGGSNHVMVKNSDLKGRIVRRIR